MDLKQHIKDRISELRIDIEKDKETRNQYNSQDHRFAAYANKIEMSYAQKYELEKLFDILPKLHKQSKQNSLIEAITNTAVGFIFNFFINLLILPLFGVTISLEQNFYIIASFTVLSVLRNFIVRRLFNKQRS